MDNNIYKPDFVMELFDNMSVSYERMNYITSFGFSLRWRRQFLSQIPASSEPIEVLDLLCGMGETWSIIHQKWPNVRLSALDFSEGMLQHAQQKNQNLYKNQVSILQQDLLNNQLPSNHFDVITCAFGLKTFDEAQLKILAAETKRVLKTGGQFSFVEVSKPSNKLLLFLFGFYMGRVIPVLGKWFGGDPVGYQHLWKYIIPFKNAKKAAQIFENAGLKAEFTSFFWDCATGVVGKKL